MRVVFDTNTVISALLFRGETSWLVAHWRGNDILSLVSVSTEREFLRVLAYPKFGLSQAQITAFAQCYLPNTERVEIEPNTTNNSWSCRDPEDSKFIELAIVGKADVLVTGDRDLLSMNKQSPFVIETPAIYRVRQLNAKK